MSADICIDPGHGGSDPGTGSVPGAREATVALEYALALRDVLQRDGLAVAMTRTTDTTVGISERARLANVSGARLFVSIHCNAGPAAAWGFQPIHAKPSAKGKAAAQAILAAVRSHGVPDGPRTRVVTDQSDDTGYTSAAQAFVNSLDPSLPYAAKDKLAREKFGDAAYRTLGVLRQTNMPAVLVELGFLTNKQERERLLSEEGREALVWGLRDGVLDALHAIAGRPVEPSYTPPPAIPMIAEPIPTSPPAVPMIAEPLPTSAPVLPTVTPHVVGGTPAPRPALRLEPITVPTVAHLEETVRALGIPEDVACRGGEAFLALLRRMAPEGITRQLIDVLDGYRATRCAR